MFHCSTEYNEIERLQSITEAEFQLRMSAEFGAFSKQWLVDCLNFGVCPGLFRPSNLISSEVYFSVNKKRPMESNDKTKGLSDSVSFAKFLH